MAHDLLVEPLLSWRDVKRRRGRTTLPGLLARLASGELADFPRLRTHQLHPWCMFLTQLAAIALHRAGTSDPRLTEEEWRHLLLALTEGHHEPWSLVVDDLSMPAFFQPPVPENSLDGWTAHDSPDDIDVLVTSKKHDVKAELILPEDIEAWAYAVVTLQTMQGVYGQGKYGIARMKKGYGNRPRVGISPDQSLPSRFSRDLGVLLTSWSPLIEAGYRDDGLALVWTQAWDGRTSLARHDLSPHFVEVCRRIRCSTGSAGISCADTTSRTRRCFATVDDETGDVGDPWIPIEKATRGALTIGKNGFHYDRLAELLFGGDFEPAAAQRLLDSDGDPVLFIASALVRGQGKTEGLHERILAVAGPARLKLGQADGRSILGKRALGRVAAAEKVSSKVLRPALEQLILGSKAELHQKAVSRARAELDARLDDIFFDHLFETLTLTDDEARLAFDERLRDLAWKQLQRAIDRSGVSDARRFKAISDAERMFNGCLKKNCPDLVAKHAIGEGPGHEHSNDHH